MPGAADTRIMTDSDVTAAAKRQQLEPVLMLFPDEIVAAVRLAAEQAATLAALTGQDP